MRRFPPEVEEPYHQQRELRQAAIFTLTADWKFYPKNWSDWYLNNTMANRDEIEDLVNAAALIAAEIDRLQNLKP